METIVIFNLEWNGVAKRKNSSIVEASQVMLHNKNLLKFLWGEATNTTIYVQKRAPHQALDTKFPKKNSQM